MADYKKMYFKMCRASEKAVRLLVQVQQECEELYLVKAGPEIEVLPLFGEKDPGEGENKTTNSSQLVK